MDDFLLSLKTRLIADEKSAPLRNAVSILKRDMEAVLSGEGKDNEIRVILSPEMAKETYRAEVTPDTIQLICGDDLGGVYALLSISERFLGIRPFDWWMVMMRMVIGWLFSRLEP